MPPHISTGTPGFSDLPTALLPTSKIKNNLNFFSPFPIIGAHNVYSSYEYVTHHDPSDPMYCDYTVYTFAFIVITIGFISLVLSVIAALCACVCKSSSDEE